MTFGLRGAQLEACDRPSQLVNQVFCAALNVPGQPKSIREHPALAAIATGLLTAQYRATVLAAIAQRASQPSKPGAHKLFLTLLGGGVFDNRPEWIAAALHSCSDLMLRSGLDITFVVFDGRHVEPRLLSLLEELSHTTGGSVIKVQ